MLSRITSGTTGNQLAFDQELPKLKFQRDGNIVKGNPPKRVGRIENWKGMHQLYIGPPTQEQGIGVFHKLDEAKRAASKALADNLFEGG